MIRFAIPGDLAARTGGYEYARQVIGAAAGALSPVTLPGGFPFPSDAELEETARLLAGAGPLLIDGLAFGALPPALIRGLPRPPVALVHHPLALETGLTSAQAAALAESERSALAEAAHIVTTSAGTKRLLVEDFARDPDRITVARPGLTSAPTGRQCAAASTGGALPPRGGGMGWGSSTPAPAAGRRAEPPSPPRERGRSPRASAIGSPSGEPLILTVATLTPRKGHDVLIDALAGLKDLPWRAVWAGPEDRDPDWAAALAARVAAAGLDGRIRRLGPVDGDRLAALRAEAAVFCLPSRYEGYGMAHAEAMAAGLPVVACAAPVFAGAGAAAMLVPPDDPEALAAALRRLLTDPDRREEMSMAARGFTAGLPGWAETWSAIRGVMERWG